MNLKTLKILAEAISDAGAWQWWFIKDDMVLTEFCDIQLYDDAKPEKDTHTTDTLAVRFSGNAFAVFLDDLNENQWPERLREDNTVLYSIDPYSLVFDDLKEAEELLKEYANKTVIKDFAGPETLSGAKHLLCARCNEVGFIIGGDPIEVAGKNGKYTEEEIEAAARKWWEYWKAYWQLRGTKDAYPEDYACETTIPISGDEPAKSAEETDESPAQNA